MELNILQKKVDDWIKKYGVRYFNELTNMAQLTEEVELIPYDQEEEEVVVLRTTESSQLNSPIRPRKTNLKILFLNREPYSKASKHP